MDMEWKEFVSQQVEDLESCLKVIELAHKLRLRVVLTVAVAELGDREESTCVLPSEPIHRFVASRLQEREDMLKRMQ